MIEYRGYLDPDLVTKLSKRGNGENLTQSVQMDAGWR